MSLLARSEYLEATAANIAMHPVTGMFAAPHESAFAAHAFRLAFPVHTFLMALSLGLIVPCRTTGSLGHNHRLRDARPGRPCAAPRVARLGALAAGGVVDLDYPAGDWLGR